MALLHQSFFTGTNGVDVNTLTPAIGASLINDGGGASLIQNNRAYNQAPYTRYRTNDTFGTANYVVRGVARRIANTSDPTETFALFARANAGVTNAIIVRVGKTSIQVSKNPGTGEVNVGSAYAWSPSVGIDYTVELVVNGSDTTVRVDGSTVIGPLTISDVTATANAQFDFFQPDGNSTRGWHLDTFEVDDTIPGGGGGPSAAARARYRRLCGVQP